MELVSFCSEVPELKHHDYPAQVQKIPIVAKIIEALKYDDLLV